MSCVQCSVMCTVFCARQWWVDRRSEELLGKETARCLICEEEETLWLQQQEDERLALALSQEFIQHKLVSSDVGWRGEMMVLFTGTCSYTQPFIPTSL